MNKMIKSLMVCTMVFGTVLHATEWYEEGDGGYTTSNGNIVPSNSGDYQNTNSVTYRLADADGNVVGDEGDLLGTFGPEGDLRGIANTFAVGFGPYVGENFFLLYMYSNSSGSRV